MNTTLVDFEVVDLLSRITGHKLSQRDITPSVIFVAALITVMLGAVFADGTVTDDKKQRLQATLNRFNLPEEAMRQLAKLMLRGVQQQKVYSNIDDLLTLTAPLSESERLLLISFGYQMSVTDGAMAPPKKKYFEAIANQLGINPRHLMVLEAGFSGEGSVEPAGLDEVRFLLDPARFQSLDAAFVKAASDMLAALSVKSEHQASQQHTAWSYGELKKFQEYRKQLDTVCHQLLQIIQNCTNRGVLPHTLAEEVKNVSHKLQSQRFRVAVVGEFSQGKSTLINALVREEIQPVRAIACNGTVTVLKYGSPKQILCQYKDGRQEQISFEQYQILATISKEAARQHRSDELARSEIEEIIFEHPDLDLCKNGVEIVDSPGLNEHPDRAAVTQKLLKHADAVIFITDASKALTQGERNLIHDLRSQINGGIENEPVNNLFILVNKIDQLDSEEDRQDVKELVEEFAYGQSPVVAGKHRVHFISAKAAMKAILEKNENDYLKTFQNFAQSLEKFLTFERGSVKIKQSAIELDRIVQPALNMLQQTEVVCNGNIKASEVGKQKAIEQIGELTGHSVRIRLVLKKDMNKLKEEITKDVEESWNEWIKVKGLLEYRLSTKAEKWSSNRDAFWDQHGIVEDYTKLFIRDLSNELNIWANEDFAESLRRKIENLDWRICCELKTIEQCFYASGQSAQSFQPKKIESFNFEVSQKGWYGDLWRWITCILIVGYFFGSDDAIKNQMKEKVIEECLAQFRKSSSKIIEEIYETIPSAFNSRFNLVDEIIARAISSCESRLEQQETECRKILEQCKAEKAWIFQKRQELEQVQNNIEAILNQSAG